MKRPLAFVLGGGGARGALQIGALRALFEAGIYPDILVGTSIGAANAAFLALHGVNLQGVDHLERVWHEAAEADLMPSNYLWLTVRALFNRPLDLAFHRMEEFFIAKGLSPEIRFGDIRGVKLYLVAADLNHGCTVLYGREPRDSVLEGVLTSTALPPWVSPLNKQGHQMMDGGAVSNLPIEPAMSVGAAEIVALDLLDLPEEIGQSAVQENGVGIAQGFGPFIANLVNAVQQRQVEMELALAQARGVNVLHIRLGEYTPPPLWDFSRTGELIGLGYEVTRRELARWRSQRLRRPRPWDNWFKRRRSPGSQTNP